MAVGTESVTATVDEGDEILKPCTDKREYRRIVLKNSLEVLLISDPDTDKHMLFYASEKYPEEHGFMKYVSEHGGSTNAYTSTEDTNYHFDVNSDCFDEALDRFAQFFIKPLMSADATMREIKAVDSENQKNLLSDSWRMRQLHKHLSREDHPYHKFSTGNLDTLHVRPEAKGIDIRSELTKFYDEYYSANIMHLVVYGKENLDKTQCLVEELFQEIRNTNKGIPRFPGQPCTSDHLQVLVEAVPIRQGHTLSVSWPVTPSIHHYEEAPCKYLSHLIGHEGEGSLFHAFKILGWATSLYAYEAGSTMEYSFFYVWIDLTDAGHEHMEDILGLLFRHSKLLQQSGVSQWIFNELSAICEAEFHYQAKIDPISYATSISTKMTMYPTKHWLVGSSLPSRFNPAILQKVLDELSPTNVRIFWESNKFEGETNKVEPWYNTAYSLEKITESTIQEWMQSAPDVNLLLPTPNVFIPTDFSLKDVKDKDIFPVLLRKTSFSRLWYKPDTKFFKPKAYIMMNFNYPLAFSSHNAGPGHIDSRVELLLKNFESKLYDMSDEEFKSNVTALIDMKLEKHKNLEEESLFYWREIQNGTLKFNRRDVEVVALRELKKEELIDFFDEYIKVDAPKKKSLSICVYGNQHLQEMASDKDNIPSPSIEIEDIVCFRKSQPLYGSLRGCSQLKL